MPAKSMLKRPEGRGPLEELYRRLQGSLGVPCESHTLRTRFGSTHVLVAGPVDAPPLLTVHGAYSSAPQNLKMLLPLTRHFRVYAPDTIGHSVMSEDAYISPADNSFGHWVGDILDGLELRSAPIVASSFGAGIALRAAAVIPERLERMALVAPSGIANGSMATLTVRLLLPWLRYLLHRTPANLLRATRPMVTEDEPEFVEQVGLMLDHVRIRIEGPRLTAPAELAGLRCPVLLFVTTDDVFFPGEAVARRARTLFPNLVGVETVVGRHLPSREGLASINEQILRFLQG